MIRQLGPPIVFVTFTSVESKWVLLIKCLYDLNSKKLRFNTPFDKLKPKHVTDLIFPMQILGFHHKILLIVQEWNHTTFVMNILLNHV